YTGYESLFPLRAFPADRHRPARLSGEPDPDAPGEAREGHLFAASDAGEDGPGEDPGDPHQPEQSGDDGPVRGSERRERHEDEGRLSEPGVAERLREAHDEGGRQLRLERNRGISMVVAADLAPAVRAAIRLLDLPDEPGAGRRLEGHELRKEPRETHDSRFTQDRLQGRDRGGRGGRGVARD